MKITDKTKNITDDSYDDIKIGESISSHNQGNFEIIEKRDNTTNGLRAYEFAPVVNGKPDTSQIVLRNKSSIQIIPVKTTIHFMLKNRLWFLH
ncbi:hypothetical protein [Staphylococcus hsinchuensis]|uniref:Uncharacterized protein n=1 Tax=Staphylococcus hsinchuensis TaxID=3051183 RepID=A0ABZ3EGC1_9STAP